MYLSQFKHVQAILSLPRGEHEIVLDRLEYEFNRIHALQWGRHLWDVI